MEDNVVVTIKLQIHKIITDKHKICKKTSIKQPPMIAICKLT